MDRMESILNLMYNFLKKKILHKPESRSSAELAADHWSKWQQQVDTDKPRWIDWGEHPTFLGLVYQELFGSKDLDLFRYLKSKHPHFTSGKALSLCSGDGGFESLLVRQGIFAEVTGIEISEYRVKKAREQYADDPNLAFIVGDINTGNYGHGTFDVVFAKAALHHIQDLEAAFKGMVECLKPGGCLVAIDFFGPTRMQWTDEQVGLANEFLKEIPQQLRTTKDGSLKTSVVRPTVQQMLDADPSEAARSSELLAFIRQHFRILQEFDIGGTVFARVFTPDIIGNFDPLDIAHQQLISEVFHKERELIKRGSLPSDFKFIIAEKH